MDNWRNMLLRRKMRMMMMMRMIAMIIAMIIVRGTQRCPRLVPLKEDIDKIINLYLNILQ